MSNTASPGLRRAEQENRLLREEVRLLSARVDDLTDQLSALRLDLEVSRVSGEQCCQSDLPAASVSAASETGPYPLPEGLPQDLAHLNPAVRAGICKDIGRFIRRALAGEHRGSSGRNRLNLSSRLWLVFRNYRGEVSTQPCKLFHRFSEAIAECCGERVDLGDSIFFGLPALSDARIVVAEAGATLP